MHRLLGLAGFSLANSLHDRFMLKEGGRRATWLEREGELMTDELAAKLFNQPSTGRVAREHSNLAV
jgi:hypothetical protein